MLVAGSCQAQQPNRQQPYQTDILAASARPFAESLPVKDREPGADQNRDSGLFVRGRLAVRFLSLEALRSKLKHQRQTRGFIDAQ